MSKRWSLSSYFKTALFFKFEEKDEISSLKELEENRYLIIEKGHSRDGKFLYNYIVYEKQYTQKVHTNNHIWIIR